MLNLRVDRAAILGELQKGSILVSSGVIWCHLRAQPLRRVSSNFCTFAEPNISTSNSLLFWLTALRHEQVGIGQQWESPFLSAYGIVVRPSVQTRSVLI